MLLQRHLNAKGNPGPVVISIPTDVLESKVKCLPKKEQNQSKLNLT